MVGAFGLIADGPIACVPGRARLEERTLGVIPALRLAVRHRVPGTQPERRYPMATAIEPIESPSAPWATRLVITSAILAALTFVLGLSSGTTDKAIVVGIAALAFAFVARIVASVVNDHRAAANVALVVGVIAFASGMQSALLGTGA